MPNAFTEQGLAMLSSILNNDKAIEVNIRTIRIFIKLREMLLTHKDILLKLEKFEQEIRQQSGNHKKMEDDIQIIFNAL